MCSRRYPEDCLYQSHTCVTRHAIEPNDLIPVDLPFHVSKFDPKVELTRDHPREGFERETSSRLSLTHHRWVMIVDKIRVQPLTLV